MVTFWEIFGMFKNLLALHILLDRHREAGLHTSEETNVQCTVLLKSGPAWP